MIIHKFLPGPIRTYVDGIPDFSPTSPLTPLHKGRPEGGSSGLLAVCIFPSKSSGIIPCNLGFIYFLSSLLQGKPPSLRALLYLADQRTLEKQAATAEINYTFRSRVGPAHTCGTLTPQLIVTSKRRVTPLLQVSLSKSTSFLRPFVPCLARSRRLRVCWC